MPTSHLLPDLNEPHSTMSGVGSINLDSGGIFTSISKKVLASVPAYNWYHGCGPTAAASLIGYWDLFGYENLFDATSSAVFSTDYVKDHISSPEHNAKYDPTPDNQRFPIPDLTSIADWFRTSVDPLKYGWSYLSYADDAFRGYTYFRGYDFEAVNQSYSSNLWDTVVDEINADRPLMFLVDTDGNGRTDHFVPVVGYDDRGLAGKFYGLYTTWSEDESIEWQEFQGMGNPWGVGYATVLRPLTSAPDDNTLYNVSLTLRRFEDIDTPGNDFKAWMTIGSKTFVSKQKNDSNSINFNWTQEITRALSEIPVKLEIWEVIESSGKKQNHVDISPVSRDIDLVYDLKNNTFTGDLAGFGGLEVKSVGEDNHRGRVWFTLDREIVPTRTLVNIDFETDAVGNLLQPGEKITDQYSAFGLSIRSIRRNSAGIGIGSSRGNPMIFDSESPTGGDFDLKTSNQGNVLIVSEDNDSSDPDDSGTGGIFRFDWNAPVSIDKIGLLDIDTNESVRVITVDASNNRIDEYRISKGAGNNRLQDLLIDDEGVYGMVVQLSGSGAITNVVFTSEASASPNRPTLAKQADNFISTNATSDLLVGLYDADRDTLIGLIEEGDTLLASELAGREVTIAAFVDNSSVFSGQVESIFLNLNDGEITRIENVEPYALFGDTNQNYVGGSLPQGANTLVFELYSDNQLKGDLLATVNRSFTIVNDMG